MSDEDIVVEGQERPNLKVMVIVERKDGQWEPTVIFGSREITVTKVEGWMIAALAIAGRTVDTYKLNLAEDYLQSNIERDLQIADAMDKLDESKEPS